MGFKTGVEMLKPPLVTSAPGKIGFHSDLSFLINIFFGKHLIRFLNHKNDIHASKMSRKIIIIYWDMRNLNEIFKIMKICLLAS
jgi:hypothetical protein